MIVVTGHGLKDVDALRGAVEEDEPAVDPGDDAPSGTLLEAAARA